MIYRNWCIPDTRRAEGTNRRDSFPVAQRRTAKHRPRAKFSLLHPNPLRPEYIISASRQEGWRMPGSQRRTKSTGRGRHADGIIGFFANSEKRNARRAGVKQHPAWMRRFEDGEQPLPKRLKTLEPAVRVLERAEEIRPNGLAALGHQLQEWHLENPDTLPSGKAMNRLHEWNEAGWRSKSHSTDPKTVSTIEHVTTEFRRLRPPPLFRKGPFSLRNQTLA